MSHNLIGGQINIMANIARMREWVSRINVKPVLRWTGFTVILTYLLYQLSKIGWSEILNALPTSPLFYALSIGFVLAPVTAEVFAFRAITAHQKLSGSDGHFKLFLRKHVFNKAIMNFTGDAFVVQRLSQNAGMPVRDAVILMKDMTLIRAFIANFWIIGLAMAAVFAGQSGVLQKITAASPELVFGLGAVCLSAVGAGVFLFRKLTRLPLRVAGKVAGIYLIRSFVVAGILMAQWSLAIPGTAISTWFVFLIVFYVTKKSPIGGELVFASVIVSLPGLGADNAAIAAMLIAMAAVTQVLYLAGFVATSEFKGLRRPVFA